MPTEVVHSQREPLLSEASFNPDQSEWLRAALLLWLGEHLHEEGSRSSTPDNEHQRRLHLNRRLVQHLPFVTLNQNVILDASAALIGIQRTLGHLSRRQWRTVVLHEPPPFEVPSGELVGDWKDNWLRMTLTSARRDEPSMSVEVEAFADFRPTSVTTFSARVRSVSPVAPDLALTDRDWQSYELDDDAEE